MNIFDSIQDTAFDIIGNTMGYNAKWDPGNGQPVKTARVLYNYPTRKRSIGDANYDLEDHTIEYKHGDFEGMKEAVDKRTPSVFIRIEVNGSWSDPIRVLKMKGKFDGKTHVAILNNP